MIEKVIKHIFGDASDKKVKSFMKLVENIKEFEEKQAHFGEEDIKNKTKEFQALFTGLNFEKEDDSTKIQEILENIKLEAFALVKTACKLLNGKSFELSNGKSMVWNMIPYDVQLVGGLAIHEGNIAEMKTGEGKTLVATLPAYLNALTGNPVHIVTVNDYLASRDAEEMGILYNTLGLSVGVVYNQQDNQAKRQAYMSNIVYATNNELGFDYLRDNMVIKKEYKAQSKLFFAIIDEIDSILIDEARTPLIISQPDNEPTTKYEKFCVLAKKLKKGVHYTIDEKQKTAVLTEEGIEYIEKLLHVENIYVSSHYNDLHHIENAIKANGVYTKDKDYLVNNGEVLIIDEHTGRVLSGRRYSEGLHQAIEAKEGVTIQQESKTLASITFQNYFRMYWKLSGMTGTAKTEEEEFYKVYALDTLSIPTNKPLIRDDKDDLLFKNEKGKFAYVLELIKDLHQTGQPILVGTVSVNKSEYLSDMLHKENIPHKVLNAKHHKHEAEIVANAGQKGSITIATNMAGRGTDIKLGKGVKELGGLIIIGTEKHETRRIDNQLRGRSGRQGDPGMTQFLISPNDDIMRIFGGDKLFGVFNSPVFSTLPENQPLTQSKMLTRKVTGVQKQVEGHHFDVRKHILEYDDVINQHRNIIYTKRNTVLDTEGNNKIIDDDMRNMVVSQISQMVNTEIVKGGEHTDKKQLIKKINDFLGIEAINDTIEIDDINGIQNVEKLTQYVARIALEELNTLKNKAIDTEEFYNLERRIILSSIDELWMRHIDAMSRLREEVAFEGYAQRNPLVVYKEKAFEKFQKLINELEYKSVKAIFSVTKITEIDQINLSDSDMEMNEIDLNDMTEIKDPRANNKQKNAHPLFVNPHNDPKSKQTGDKKVKIRV